MGRRKAHANKDCGEWTMCFEAQATRRERLLTEKTVTMNMDDDDDA